MVAERLKRGYKNIMSNQRHRQHFPNRHVLARLGSNRGNDVAKEAELMARIALANAEGNEEVTLTALHDIVRRQLNILRDKYQLPTELLTPGIAWRNLLAHESGRQVEYPFRKRPRILVDIAAIRDDLEVVFNAFYNMEALSSERFLANEE